MEKAIYFDMDGSLNRFYDIPDWREKLDAHDPSPYRNAAPMWDMVALCEAIGKLAELGVMFGIISWLSKNSDTDYNRETRQAKREWLEEMGLMEHMEEVHLVKYGTPKHTVPNVRHAMLVDDNASVRAAWENYGGETIDPTEVDLIELFNKMIEEAEEEK